MKKLKVFYKTKEGLIFKTIEPKNNVAEILGKLVFVSGCSLDVEIISAKNTVKTDKNGCSTCLIGEEQYEAFTHRGKEYYQYDYRDTDGELFGCVKHTLEECRENRDEWLKNK